MPVVDLAFRVTGSKMPVDHGYALYSAISRLLPEIQEQRRGGFRPPGGSAGPGRNGARFQSTVR